MSKQKKGPGRPLNSKTAERVSTTVEKSRCPRCESTRRSGYIGAPRVFEGGGERDGRKFRKQTRRVTTCLDCGQKRFDWEVDWETTKK